MARRARILSSFVFAVSEHNLPRIAFASTERGSPATSFKLLTTIWAHRRQIDVLLIDGVVPQMWPALLQSFLPGCRAKVMVTDCFWERSPSTLKGRLKLFLMRKMVSRFDRCILYAEVDRDRFAEYFQVDASKFIAVRHHQTMHPGRYPLKVFQGGYIFAGGNSDRDYTALVAAMHKLDCLCLLACGSKTLYGLKLPANAVRIEANPLQFRQLLAGAAIVVVPLTSGLLRSAGQQTFVNAMLHGKPVVVTDVEGAADYIRDGETGLLARPEDLLAKLQYLLEDPERARRIGAQARLAAASMTVESTYDRICEIADEISDVIAGPVPTGTERFAANEARN